MFFRFFFLFFDCRIPGPQFCSSPSLLAFWVPLCILPVYELESLFLGFFINIFAFYRSKKKKKKFRYCQSLGPFLMRERCFFFVNFSISLPFWHLCIVLVCFVVQSFDLTLLIVLILFSY